MKIRVVLFCCLFILFSCSKEDSKKVVDEVVDINEIDEPIDDNADNDNENNNDSPPENRPPGNFNLLSLENGAENVELTNPEFNWQEAIDPDGDAVTYDIYFDQGIEPPTTLLAENLVETSFILEALLPRNTIYSWQVVATDIEGATTTSNIHTFTTRSVIVSELVSEAEFEGREEHTSILFNDRIWIIGGVDRFERADDIWSSENGINWTKETNNAGFASRGNHTSVVFNNKIWVIGGIDNSGNLLNDIWSSEDGINWIQENTDAPFAKRYNHTLTVYDNKMWLIGGQDSYYEFNDVWSSEDGINWIEVNPDADFPSRQGHSTVVFNDRLYVIAGINSNQGSGFGALNDVWSSNDGIDWEIETVDADFPVRWGHSSIVLDNEIWVIGGLGAGRRNDIWSSDNGIDWTNENPNSMSFSSRFSHKSVLFNDLILIIGGNDGSRKNDIWSILK